VILLALLLATAQAPVAGPADPRTPDIRFRACVRRSDDDAAGAIAEAKAWAASGGGIPAGQCLGIAETAANNFKAAADAFTATASIADQIGDARAATLWVSAGDAALAGGDPLGARKAIDAALAKDSLTGELRGEAFLDRARADVAGDDNQGARADIDQALTLVPSDPVAWLLSATLARRMGDGTRAAADIGEAKTRTPNEPAILLEAGNIALLNGNPADARVQWGHAKDADPSGEIGRSAAAKIAANGGGAAAQISR
jgi:tetratricopeptide (TPR) repeat protein